MEKKPSSTAVELPTVVHSAALPGRVTEAQTGSEKPPISAEEYYQNYKEIWKEGIHLVSRSDGLSSWRQLVAELWGTMLLVFFGTGKETLLSQSGFTI